MYWYVAKLLRSLFGPSEHRKRPIRSSYRPQLFGLEDLIMPANLTWVGAAGASWSLATNWSPAQIPGNGDSLTFTAPAGVGANTNSTMNLGGGVQYHIAQLNLVGGYDQTITLNSDLFVDVLNMESGTITGVKQLKIWQRTNVPNLVATNFATSFWKGASLAPAVCSLQGRITTERLFSWAMRPGSQISRLTSPLMASRP